jgi:hypothetical protein
MTKSIKVGFYYIRRIRTNPDKVSGSKLLTDDKGKTAHSEEMSGWSHSTEEVLRCHSLNLSQCKSSNSLRENKAILCLFC